MQPPSNPVGRAIYESMFLIALPVGLMVLKVRAARASSADAY